MTDDPLTSTVRLMSDYGSYPPLWDSEGGIGIEHLGLDPSSELAAALTAWQDCFEENVRRDKYWGSAPRGRWYATEGRRLQRELSRAIPSCEVVLDLWPVGEERPR